MKNLRVLIACERSQIEQQAFAALGCESFSLDILPCYGPCPSRHIVADAYEFPLDGFDLVVAHPPCTYLTKAGNARLYDSGRVCKVVPAIRLWYRFLHECPCPVAVENPVGLLNNIARPSQIFDPWEFGDPYQKKTCLWLNGLPRLQTRYHHRPAGVRHWCPGKKQGCSATVCSSLGLKLSRADSRSMSFPSVARAMAVQWTEFLKGNAI